MQRDAMSCDMQMQRSPRIYIYGAIASMPLLLTLIAILSLYFRVCNFTPFFENEADVYPCFERLLGGSHAIELKKHKLK